MSSALPGFQQASELGPSPNREQELEDLCHRQAEQIERLEGLAESNHNIAPQPKAAPTEAIEQRLKAIEKKSAETAHFTHEDRNKLNELISDLIEQGKEQSELIGLLRDGIVRLQNEVASCKQLQENHGTVVSKVLDRVNSLENKKANSKISKERAEKIRSYLKDNGTEGKFLNKRTKEFVKGKAVRFEVLKGHLSLDKYKLNRALHSLFQTYPGEYCVKKVNKKTWMLVERPKL